MALPTPETREEMFLAAAAGEDVNLPTPITRRETYLAAIVEVISNMSGASPEDIVAAVVDYLEDHPVTAPVTSVNGQTGDVEITASGLGALTSADLADAIDDALAEAKESGEFDGQDGQDGNDYVLTAQDMADIAALVDTSATVTNVTGTTPSITLADNTVFSAGTLTSLAVTGALAEGQACTIIFTSGATATQLTLPVALKMPDNFAVEANRLYEISIMGSRGAVQSWDAT